MSQVITSVIRLSSADPWIQKRDQRLFNCRHWFTIYAVLLLSLLSLTISKEVSDIKGNSTEKSEKVKRPKNDTVKKIPINNILLKNYKDEGYHVAYSGYLRSNSSMLQLQTNDTFNDNIFLANETIAKKSKTKKHRRSKRGVTHLYNMIICATGCDPLAYKGYGCYCGFLGSGYPMDGIDRCCKMHDWCYDATDCPMFVEYFVPYYWKCYHGYKPICAIEHGEWGSTGSCAQRLCECDRSFAECLRRYRCPRHKAVCTSSPWRLIQNIFMII